MSSDPKIRHTSLLHPDEEGGDIIVRFDYNSHDCVVSCTFIGSKAANWCKGYIWPDVDKVPKESGVETGWMRGYAARVFLTDLNAAKYMVLAARQEGFDVRESVYIDGQRSEVHNG